MMSVAACNSDDPANSTPAPLTPAPFLAPEDSFVFIELVSGLEGGSDAVYRIVVFDVNEMREAASFRISDLVGYPPSPVMSGERVIANHSQRVTSYSLNGSDVRDVWTAAPGGSIVAAAGSPDGTTLAVTDFTRPRCPTLEPGQTSGMCEPFENVGRLLFIDLATGDVTREVLQTDPAFDAMRGHLGHVWWWNDGSRVTIQNLTQSEFPGGTAVVAPDGAASVSTVFDFPFPDAPDGRYMFTGEMLETCQLGIDRVEATIWDLADDSPAATLRDETRLVHDIEWSPGGHELLFSTKTFNEVPPDSASGGTVPCRERVDGSEQWAVLHADGSPPETGVQPFDVIDEWHGDRLIVYTCEGERVFEPRYCIGGGAQSPVEVTFRGQTIANTTDFRVLGWID